MMAEPAPATPEHLMPVSVGYSTQLLDTYHSQPDVFRRPFASKDITTDPVMLWEHKVMTTFAAIMADSVTPLATVEMIVAFGAGTVDCPVPHLSGRTQRDGRLASTLLVQMAARLAGQRPRATDHPSSLRYVPIYVQNPNHTSADKNVLVGNGLLPIEDPHGFLKVASTTFVVSMFPTVPVRQIIADMGSPWPALMLCNRVGDLGDDGPYWEDNEGYPHFRVDAATTRVKAWISEHYHEVLMTTSYPNLLDCLAFYVRK